MCSYLNDKSVFYLVLGITQVTIDIVGCDMKVGSGKTKDLCGVCGGNGSTCQSKYSWSLESISACSKSCGGGFKMAAPICKSLEDDSTTDEENCNLDKKPTKTILPCNMHPCATNYKV
ncbi:hypothetical protein KQX54_010441 [Cotesia glomerata]|uniref:Uncharacterized protein n=1 Tax=Cotesia glomerata TaxID=32391 RepID=A0AAV7HQT6_COTGL|nr:hypothetical protein KQX54_010441 [Cotesia glomerata]